MALTVDVQTAQSSTDHTIDYITPDALRAPETILGGPWNEKVDIWIFGCLVRFARHLGSVDP
jgi:serine/threonine-protein kinase SRPK3